MQPVDLYSRVDRAAKRIRRGFTFLAFLLFDIVGGVRVSGVEYLLVGAALVLFFVLLLAFAEVIGFTPAYVVASAAIVGLNSLYSAAVLGSWRRAAFILALLSGLYAVLYMLLSLKAFSLLIGSLLLFLALAALMYLTRNVRGAGGNGGGNRDGGDGLAPGEAFEAGPAGGLSAPRRPPRRRSPFPADCRSPCLDDQVLGSQSRRGARDLRHPSRCSMTGERYEADKIHGLSNAGRPCGPLRLERREGAEPGGLAQRPATCGVAGDLPSAAPGHRQPRRSGDADRAAGPHPAPATAPRLAGQGQGRLPTGSFKARGLAMAV